MTVPSPATEPSVSQPYSAAANQTSTCHFVVVSTILTVALRCPSDTRDTSGKAHLMTFGVLVTCINAYQSYVKHLSRLISFHGLAFSPPPPRGKKTSLFHGLQNNKSLYYCLVNLQKR